MMTLTSAGHHTVAHIRSSSSDADIPSGNKRVKLSRAKTSCLKCRARKAKCGGSSPEACSFCAKRGLKCVWPEEDRRTLRFRRDDGTTRETSTDNIRFRGESSISGVSLPEILAQGAGWTTVVQGTSQLQPPIQSNLTEGNDSDIVEDLFRVPDYAQQLFQPQLELDQSWRNWIFPSPVGSPGPINLGLDASARELFGADSTDAQVQLFLNGGHREMEDGNMGLTNNTAVLGHMEPNVSATDGIMRIKYLRTHGRTAYVPGTIVVPIRIQLQHPRTLASIDSPPSTCRSDTPISPHSRDTLKHLLEVFQAFLHPQYPCIDCKELEQAIDTDPLPSFLMNCVAAASARFSKDPRVALPSLKPEAYGDIYYEKANAMLGTVIKIPLRETVIGLVLLAGCGDSVTGQWMLTGIATRMAIDLGLHRKDYDSTNSHTSRQNRLCFWSVLMLDYMVSLGVGRATSLRPESITQILPTEEDMQISSTSPRSPFPFAAEMMLAYGPLINALNSEDTTACLATSVWELVRTERTAIMHRYQGLPQDMQCVVENLRMHNEAGQAAMFLHLHLWIHTILTSSILGPFETHDQLLQRTSHLGTRTGILTPTDKLSRSGAKLIVEYLTLCAVLNPAIYYTQAFLGQPLFTAGIVIVHELQRHAGLTSRQTTSTNELDITSSLLTTIGQSQLDIIKNTISETGEYWRGAALVRTALEHSINHGRERDEIWVENESYAVEVYDWALPGRYRADGTVVN